MHSVPSVVRNAERVVTLFGGWPSFHDAEIHRVVLDRGIDALGPTATFVVHVFDHDGTMNELGYFRRRVSALVTLPFDGVQDLDLRYDLGTQNVIFDLTFTSIGDGRTQIAFEQSFGLAADFTCTTVDVLDAQLWP